MGIHSAHLPQFTKHGSQPSQCHLATLGLDAGSSVWMPPVMSWCWVIHRDATRHEVLVYPLDDITAEREFTNN